MYAISRNETPDKHMTLCPILMFMKRFVDDDYSIIYWHIKRAINLFHSGLCIIYKIKQSKGGINLSKKIIIGCFVLIVIVMLLGTISYSSKIANPFVGLKGLAQISMGGEKVEKISDKPLRYISKSYEDFTTYMESEGYTVEQLGRGFQLQKGNESKLLVSEGFMGMYEIFSE
ncbi:hypothetical protein TEGL_22030 [Terrisporobacter glycolicus ATCC 14880 = DSM 1288]|uniref:Uncharacterized protein n=1 Tax=Terrisporobacter glycolicus ATCC 14880 = DSM 1288 TaxID=1121315 RepID=A0ABZ2EV41_9FIRM